MANTSNLKPWTKGVSGNPKGRPKGATATLRTLARREDPNTVKRLAQLRDQDDDKSLALEASKVLASYSTGIPIPMKAEEPGDDLPASVSDAALEGTPEPEEAH